MKDINNMTLKEKLGQLLFVGFDGYEYNDHIKTMVEEYKVGNVILFTRNIKDLKQLAQLNKTLHEEIVKHTGIMPFISIDQEGGIVTRIMNGATFCPGAMTIAATNSDNSRIIGEIMGDELTHLGINVNLAPILDVNNNPKNPVIGVRSYSDDPKVVSQYGLNFIKGLQSKGIIATAKHFPGHGDVEVDSHLGLPIVNHDKNRLSEIELYPFKQALDTVDAIMSAHILFNAYEENGLPATLSKKVLTDLLRKELGYQGLIISDCMEMKAIDDIYTTAVGVMMGLEAGLDMAFISHTMEKQINALKLIEEAINEGKITLAQIDEKVNRILKYKAKVSSIIEKNFLHNSQALDYFNGNHNKEIAQSIVDNSLTLVKGERFLLTDKTLLLATIPYATTIAEDMLDPRNIIDMVRKEIPSIDCMKMPMNEVDENILKAVDNYDTIFVCSYNANINHQQAKLINLIMAKGKRLFVLSTRNPYDLLALDVDNFASLYEYTPNSVKTIIKYLKGEIAPRGKLPIKLQKKFKVGASLYVGLEEYPLDENIKYLHLLKKCKVDTVFISYHMPEMHDNSLLELNKVIETCRELNIKIILDVNRKTLETFRVPDDIYSLRLDYGFTVQDILTLGDKPYLIELNASAITLDEIKFLLNNGLDFKRIRISHNFYPKPYTGLTHEEVLQKNQLLKSLGLQVMAYIPSQVGKRPPIKEGLPTVEKHRNANLISTLADMDALLVDEVFFGDAYASEEELETAVNFDRLTLTIPIIVYSGISDIEKELLTKTHYNRLDANEYFVRSSIREKREIKPFNTINRNRKAITIDNVNFMRYQGEVGIMKTELPADERVNVIGMALISDFLLDRIKPGQKFKFVIQGEYIQGEYKWKK